MKAAKVEIRWELWARMARVLNWEARDGDHAAAELLRECWDILPDDLEADYKPEIPAVDTGPHCCNTCVDEGRRAHIDPCFRCLADAIHLPCWRPKPAPKRTITLDVDEAKSAIETCRERTVRLEGETATIIDGEELRDWLCTKIAQGADKDKVG